MRQALLLAGLTLCGGLCGALPAQESPLHAEFRQEGERFHEHCLDFKIIGCGQVLLTDHPLHLALGSLAPKNGVGSGLAFTTHYTPNETWRLFLNADAVATPNGSWRAGAYLNAVLIRRRAIKVVTGSGSAGTRPSNLSVREMPVFHAYSQAISLNNIPFYGLGPGTSSQLASFGMTQTIAGGSVTWPLFDRLKLSLKAEANGRFFSLRNGNVAGNVFSQAYSENSAPGFRNQPAFGQFGQGIQIQPALANGYVQLNYNVGYQEWVAPGSAYSFRRFKTDLSHEFRLYRNATSYAPRTFNGPDSCAQDVNTQQCPSITRNLEGSVELRFLYTTSYTSGGNTVPFYLDPTIGGSDINGSSLLASFPDYRFRGPNFMVFRASFEHSLYKWPIGVKVLLDEGQVGLKAGDLGDHLVHSYAAGFTVRAGGLPVVNLLFAWGGGQGSRTIASVSPSLLGGSARPSLY